MRSYKKRDPKRIDLSGLQSCLQDAVACITSLKSATGILPDVDDQGNSECPFARELYEEKEQRQRKLQSFLDPLHEYLMDVQCLIEAYRRDLTVVSANRDRLHGDQAREHFSEEEAALAGKYKHYLQLRDRIARTLESAKQALNEACARRYPDLGPEEGDSRPLPMPPEVDPSAPQLSGADKELDDLFELDRRRQ